MMPCACHCAACRAAGHGNACVVLRISLLRLFHGKVDIVDLVLRHLRHYHRASGWGTAHFDTGILCVQYGPAGDVIAAGDADGRIHLICSQTGEKISCPLKVDGDVCSVAYSTDGTKLAAGLAYPSNSVLIFDLQTNEQICFLKAHSSQVYAVAWSPCGQWLASGGGDRMIYVYDAKTFEVKSSLTGHGKRVAGVCFDRTGKTIASCSWDVTISSSIEFWDSATGAAIGSPVSVLERVDSIEFAPCGNKLAAACGMDGVKIFSKESTGNFVFQSTMKCRPKYMFTHKYFQ